MLPWTGPGARLATLDGSSLSEFVLSSSTAAGDLLGSTFANPQLAGSSVGKNEIATAAVGNDEIQSLAVDTSEIAYDAVNRSKPGGGGEPVVSTNPTSSCGSQSQPGRHRSRRQTRPPWLSIVGKLLR